MPADGDPFGGLGSEHLFEYLHRSKSRSPRADADDAAADIVLVDRATTPANPHQIVVSITPFGLDGPWVDRPATEFTLQAAGGSIGFRGLPDQEPLAAGGRIGEWMTGTYAALAALAALYRVRTGGDGEVVDVAMLDCVAATMAIVPSVYASFFGWPPMTGTGRTIEVPSVEPTADGYVVFTTNSAQQYSDFCVLIGHPELLDDHKLSRPNDRFVRRDEFEAFVHDFTAERTTADVLEQAVAVPHPEWTGAERRDDPHVHTVRGTRRVRAKRVGTVRATAGAVQDQRSTGYAPTRRTTSAPAVPCRLSGVRVVDCTAWWAGPSATAALACLGADVIKVESVTRPDLMRYAAARPATVDEWWEWSPLFHTGNAGKRAITLDLTRPEGVAVFERLLRTADVLVENYTPRVMEQFGLDWDRVHEINPDVIMTRMPAFGLDGPWRDNTGFAQTMECISGMAWLTGFADGPPVLVRGACDPLAGMHAVIATLLALLDRNARGGGRHVEATMVEAALNAAAEQVLEFSATGTVLTRNGNRSRRAVLQGLYRCAGEDSWVAIAVETGAQREALANVLDTDAFDEQLGTWTSERSAGDVADELCAAGVPAAEVIASRDVVHNPQLQHRGLFEIQPHRVTGEHALPTMPFRFRTVDHWLQRPAPTIGQHNDEVLAELGLTPEEVAELRAGECDRRATDRSLSGSDLVEGTAVLRLGLASGPQWRQRCIDHERAPERRAELDKRVAPRRHGPFRRPPLLVGDPRRPIGERPDGDALAIVGHRDAERAQQVDVELGCGRAPDPVQGVEQFGAGARRDGDDLVRVERTAGVRSDEFVDRRCPGRGLDDAVETTAAEAGRDSPPLHQRRILHRGMRQLVFEVGGQALPAIELPHVDHFGPAPGRPHRPPHAVAELVAFLAPDGAPVGSHVVHVLGAVGPDDVDQFVDVDLAVGHQAPSSRVTTLPISLRGSASTISIRTGTLYGARCSRHKASSVPASTTAPAERNHERHRHFAETFVGGRGYGCVRDGRRQPQHFGHLFRKDLQAAAIDHVRHPAVDPHEPVVVDVSDVPRAEPSVVGEPVGEVGAVGIAGRGRRRQHLQLPRVVGAHRNALVGTAHRSELGVAERLRVGCGPSDDLAAELGLAVAVQHRDAEPITEPAGLQWRQRRADAAHVLQRCEVVDGHVIGEHRHRRRRQYGRPDAEPADGVGERRRLEPSA